MSEDPAVVQLLIAGLTDVKNGITALGLKVDSQGDKLETMRVGIADLGIKPRLEGLEGFRRKWEPKFIVGLALATFFGAITMMAIHKIWG